MKKSTKALIAATAAISLVCIGTVSYAAWTSGNMSGVEVTGSTALISSVGGVTATPSSDSGTLVNNKYTMNKLIPIDHNGTVSGAVKYWEFDLSSDALNQAINYTVLGSLSDLPSDGSSYNDIGLYWSTDTPGVDTVGAKITSSAQKIKEDSAGNALTDFKVYIFLKSNSVDAMGASITLTFSADKAS